MNKVSIAISWLFGLVLLGLSFFVAAETISRKLFNFSFQGADELGGYVLAVGGALSFTIALLQRAHIRIDFVYNLLPPFMQAILNWLSAVSLAALGFFLARYCWMVIRDTLQYGSTAPTAWATPMIYPQTVWFVCLLVFTVISLLLALQATRHLISGNITLLNRDYKPVSVQDEMTEEIEDIERRQLS